MQKDGWHAMELEGAGCVFLPLTNYRTFQSGTGVTPYPGDAWYWSSTSRDNGSSIRALAFNNIETGASTFSASTNNLQTKKTTNRYLGLAVRLIRDVD